MAKASVTVYSAKGDVIRTFGGNNSDVRGVVAFYQSLTLERFLIRHPLYSERDFPVSVSFRRKNNRSKSVANKRKMLSEWPKMYGRKSLKKLKERVF